MDIFVYSGFDFLAIFINCSGGVRGAMAATLSADTFVKSQVPFIYKMNNFESAWIQHPEKDVDLCVLPIHQLYKEYKPNPYYLFATYLSENAIPTQDEIKRFSHITKDAMRPQKVLPWVQE